MKKVLPKIVSPGKWANALEKIRIKEKKATKARDALAAERKKLPMVRIEKRYSFDGPSGKVILQDLFEGRPQLILYNFMFAPDVSGWPTAGCPGCSMMVDNIGQITHLHARDISVVLVSLAPLVNIENYKKRMGWNIPWVSSAGSDFNVDFGASTAKGETFRLTVFLKDGDEVFKTYVTQGRGVESLGSNWTFMDLTPFGRQEDWEDSPKGWPKTKPYVWWRRHDEYV
jgi:predicted dithiol-disulfide oxidoreductase (DUF899 family)